MEQLSVSSCRSCGADIVWLRTENGRWAPIDADCVDPADLTEHDDQGPLWTWSKHSAHFHKCKAL